MMAAATAVHTTAVHATVPRDGGAGSHSLSLSVTTDTLPGTSATRYVVPATAPVVIRYTLVNTSEAGILNVHVDDPDVPSSAITCVGGTALLPPLATRQCTATVPAADGSRVRTVHASGTLAWFGTEATASATTGYVGYKASLSVKLELVASAPAPINYQITNTGDVPLGGLKTVGCTPAAERSLRPGDHVVCSFTPRAANAPHVDKVVATATPQITVLTDTGALAAAPPVQASDQGTYVGLAAPAAPTTPTAPTTPDGAGPVSPIGTGTPTTSSSSPSRAQQQQPGLALNGGVPNVRSGAGFPLFLKHARHSLPWLIMVFLVVFVPVTVRLARANRSSGR